MQIVWLRTSKMANRLRSLYLMALMPASVFIAIALVEWYMQWFSTSSLTEAANLTIMSLPVILIWLFISIMFHRQLIFSQAGAEPIERKERPELYNLVENLAISRWLPLPKIWIMEDDSLNAFATWWNSKSSRIVFSRGLLKKLNKKEIEAVAAHEMTHIINEDVKIMLISTLFIWIIWTVGEILIRTRWGGDKDKWSLITVIWIALYALSFTLLPLINLAISRKREYLADAWSVELTKNKEALISALKKISQDSTIEAMWDKWSWVTAMCIFEPRKIESFKSIRELFSTHPSMENRIEMLEKY